jgi:GTP pyrophosphokinase
MLENYFLKQSLEPTDKNISDFRKFVKSDNLTDLFYRVAAGKIKPKDIKSFSQLNEKGSWLRYISRPFGKSKSAANSTRNETLVEQLAKKPESLVLGDDIQDLRYSIAKCCNPIPGDDVIGFLTPRGSINIHRTSCSVAIQNMSRYGNRMVKTKWRNNESIGFLTGVMIKGIDRPGLVKQISEIISDKYKISMRSFHMDTSEGMTEGIIMVYVQDTKILNNLIDHLKKIKELQVVKRIDRSKIATG